MRRFFIALFCCLLLTAGVQAASTATGLDSSTVVAANGTCQVTLTLQLRLDEVPGSLAFPLPREAKDISVNGSSVRAPLSGGLRMADLSGAVPAPGAQTLVIRYALPDAVEAAKSGKLTLKLELLSGFAYPIEHMRFSVTLPGAPEGTPEFTSTYHQEAVGSIITLTTDGGTITGEFTQGLKDHESLHMSLPVTEAMFPQPISKKWSVGSEDIIMYCVTVLALLYYLAALQACPPAGAPGPGPRGSHRRRAWLLPHRAGGGSDHDRGILGPDGLPADPTGRQRPGAAAQAHGHGQRAQRF